MRIIIVLLSIVLEIYAQDLIQPIEPVKNIDKQKAQLGKMLFFDTTLSKDNTISCASCHKAEAGWADTTPISRGVYGRKGKINSPTILNAVFNFKQFWNGRADTLQEQVSGPIHQSFEMDMDEKSVLSRLQNNPTYRSMFQAVYATPIITFTQVSDAIAEFEKTLTTPDAKFDLYLKHKAKLTPQEKKGYMLFRTYGCITCHNGINIGGNSFQKIGIVIPYKNCFGDRYEITKREFDKCMYKVPTLRNINKTAPYFHDGSAATLEVAIKTMAYHNLGFELMDEDIQSIKAFLETLSADLQKDNK